jgi:predicted DNA-binding protein
MTTKSMRNKLEYLVRHTGRAEADIVALAVEKGLDDLYRQELAEAYLGGLVDRHRAVAELGKDAVEELDYARMAVDADVKWGTQGA